jgi:cell division transport system ATP-binding protein
LADEPTGNVDDRIGLRLLHLFGELHKMGTTVLIATHSEPMITRFRHPLLQLADGAVTLSPPGDGALEGSAA